MVNTLFLAPKVLIIICFLIYFADFANMELMLLLRQKLELVFMVINDSSNFRNLF